MLFLAYKGIRWAYADQLGSSDDINQVQRAAALDASNFRLYDKLGLIRLFSVNEAHPAEAVKYFKQAIVLAPRRAGLWVDLASACDWNRDLACSDGALQRALELSPTTPRLEWITANHYVRTKRLSLSLPHLRRLLEMSTEYAWPVFGLCTRVFADPAIIRDKVLPVQRDPTLKLSLADFLSMRGEFDSADSVWSEIEATRTGFSFHLIQPYLQRSLDAGRIDQAERVWTGLKHLRVILDPKKESEENLVYDGGFDLTPLNAAFDWRFHKLPFVATDFHDLSGVEGTQCVRIDFTVARNDGVEPIFQLVPVRPSTSYVLTAKLRSSSITSDSGPRLRVEDPTCPVCLDTGTEGTVGTTPWHPVRLKFTTGSQTRLIRLSVWRPRSRAFPTQITGSLWVDDVSIKPAATVDEGAGAKSDS
jgi:hypothetical protein